MKSKLPQQVPLFFLYSIACVGTFVHSSVLAAVRAQNLLFRPFCCAFQNTDTCSVSGLCSESGLCSVFDRKAWIDPLLCAHTVIRWGRDEHVRKCSVLQSSCLVNFHTPRELSQMQWAVNSRLVQIY